MPYKFGVRSKSNLSGVKPQLQALFNEAITNSPHDFVITCGMRTIEEQRVLVATGKSTTMKSKHLTGHAVDFACFDEAGKITWEGEYYKAVSAHIKKVASKQGIKITWGGDWQSFVDMPHFQLEA
jgi:peptidoglycan L-alanyl-D-glutamate endopeptidase CwlK